MLDIANGPQTITSTLGFLGVYGQDDLGVVRLDGQIIAGGGTNDSSRTIYTPGGSDTATASYTSWFFAPQVGATLPVLHMENNTDVSVVGKVGYIGGSLGGYSESGSAYGITVGAQTIGILNGYAGLAAETTLGNAGSGDIKARADLGVFAQNNVGATTVPVAIAGIDTAGAVVPSGTTYGAKAGVNFEVPITDVMTLGAGATGSLRNDGQFAGTARVKLGGSY
jgi:hypothetical protein